MFNYDYVNLNYFVKVVSKVIKTQYRYIRLSTRMTSGRVLHSMSIGISFRSKILFCNRMSKFSVHAYLLHDIISQLIELFSAKAS